MSDPAPTGTGKKPRAKAKAEPTPQDKAIKSHSAKPRSPDAPLDERERLFVAAYTGAANYVGAEAARMAGYSDKGGGAAVMAARLKERANVAAAIERATAERLDSLGINKRAVMEEMALIAFARADMIIEPDGDGGTRLKQAGEINPRAWAAIKSIQAVTEETTQESGRGSRTTVKRLISVTFHDKRQALAHLMENLGLLKAKEGGDQLPRNVVIDLGSIKPMDKAEADRIRAEQEAEAAAVAQEWGE